MADNIRVNAGFFSKTLASKEVDVGTTDAADLIHFQRMLPQHLNSQGTPQDITALTPLPVSDVGAARTPLKQMLSGAGVSNAIGNYSDSGSPLILSLQPSADQVYRIQALTFFLAGNGAYLADGYGVLSARSNGVAITLQSSAGVILDLAGGVTITRHAEFARAGALLSVFEGSTEVLVSARFDLRDVGGLRLDGSVSGRIEAALSDDFSGLTQHYALAEGVIE